MIIKYRVRLQLAPVPALQAKKTTSFQTLANTLPQRHDDCVVLDAGHF